MTVKTPYDNSSKNENKVYICFRGKTQSVSVNALQPLLNQGAKLGRCDWYSNSSTPEMITINIPDKELPRLYSFKAYPNPFINTTQIQYEIAFVSTVAIKLYDLMGREVSTVFTGERSVGTYTVNVDGSNLPNGIYLCQMISVTGDKKYIQTKKLIKLE